MRRIDFAEATGKVIKGQILSMFEEVLLVTFEDETYAAIAAERGWDDIYISRTGDVSRHMFKKEDLIDVGLYTKKELEDLEAAEKKVQEDESRRRKLMEYRKLQKDLGLDG
jgi:hypothetical protein